MKSTLLTIMTICLVAFSAKGQLVNCFHEEYAVDGMGPGTTTYRIFADLQDADDFVSSVYAAANDFLFIGSTDDAILNDALGATVGSSLQLAFCGFAPTLCFDSFVTIGWANDTEYYDGSAVGCGQAVSALATLPGPNVIGDSFGSDSPAPELDMQDGAWFTTNAAGCNENGLGVGPNNRVLLAQVTINTGEDLEYTLNIQIFNGSDGNDPLFYVGETSNVDGTDIDGSCMGLQYPLPGNCTGEGCMDDTACNYDPTATIDDGSCFYIGDSCDDGDAMTTNDMIQDNCECGGDLLGCTDMTACNYNPDAVVDDGSCMLPDGCTDDTACNYDMNAMCDNGSCTYPGCTDMMACNYDMDAGCDDGTCILPDGCTDPTACNYDMNAQCDDGTCILPDGCTDPTACNYNMDAQCDDGSCILPDGCTDDTACNYDMNAMCDDGTCEYPEEYYDCDGFCLNDSDGDGICDELEVPGCTDEEACNYNPDATDEDDSCTYPEEYYDCDGNCINDTDGDGVCDELEVSGCTDPAACNYNPDATDDDDSCEYLETYDITGEIAPGAGSTEDYSYTDTAGSSYDWTVTGGTIVSGQGTSTITVEWDGTGTGTVSVVETDADGCVGEEVSIDIDIVTGIEMISEDVFSIYPNPANDNITVVSAANDQIMQVMMFDASGKLVLNTQLVGQSILDVQSLSDGMYTLQIVADNNVETKKVVINH